ncbi:MAG: cytochrome c3 family protein, partial [Polyangiales bacterium]
LPPGPVSFEVALRRDPGLPPGTIGAYYVEFLNRVGTEPPRRYDVVLTYGGALFRQQYLTRRATSDGSLSYFILPMQYNYQRDFANPDPDDWPWRDYFSDQWFDFGLGLLDEPSNQDSFDNNCAGCHFTGYELRGDETVGWAARAVADAAGAFDYDGDGRPELINVGCESCHGPGSEHLELTQRGGHIVSPGSLTPGRASALCGSCHSRPIGIGAGMTGLALSSSEQMPPPGIRRADLAIDKTTRVGGAPSDFFTSGDAASHFQQYSGYLQSAHYRNPARIATCTGCHDPHANFDDVYGDAVSDNLNAVCTVCHSDPQFLTVLTHVQEQTGFSHETITREFRCTECHMVPTAKSGASVKALLDVIPNGDPPVQYFWNDIAAHRMTMTGRAAYQEQPIAATNQCAPCHGGFFPNR